MRFLKRRQEKAAARTRRQRRWSRRSILAALGAGALVVIAGGGWWLHASGAIGRAVTATEQRIFAMTAAWGFAVDNVEVEGRARASREAILNALDVARGSPILALDPAQAKRRLESIAWIRSAAVERRLPDTVYVRLVERQPMAFWQRHGKLVLIDRDGVSITSEQLGTYGNLIVLVGPDAPAKGAALLDMLASEPELAPHVAAAVRVGGRRWNLRLDNGIDIALPEEDPAGAWHRLAQLERSDSILERDIQMVDLRLPDRLVVRPAPEPSKTPPKKGRQPGKTT